MNLTKWKSIYSEADAVIPEIGDKILMGKFKNKSATIEDFGTEDKNNQPTVITDKGERHLYNFRIAKLMKDKE